MLSAWITQDISEYTDGYWHLAVSEEKAFSVDG